MEVHGAWFPPWLAARLIHYQKWVPVAMERWAVITSNVKPHVHTLTTKTVEIYEMSNNVVSPHIIKVVEFVDPYFQEFRKISNPHIDQVATVARTQLDTLHVSLIPYMHKAVHGYGTFLRVGKNVPSSRLRQCPRETKVS